MAEKAYRPMLDHLGFKIDDDATFKSYEDSQSQVMRTLAKRARRWKSVMSLHQYKHKTPKMRRFVRKGIPNELRAQVWMAISGAQRLLDTNRGFYEKMKAVPKPQNIIDDVNTDLDRTFPQNIYFKDKSRPDSLAPSLHNVLLTFAIHRPKIGYCQGLNYVAGLMLLVVRDEEKVFWLLDALTQNILPDMYVREPVAMLGLQRDLRVLSELVKEKIPEVDLMMTVQKVDWSFVCTKWFICVFIDVLPADTVLRIWDAMFYEGKKVLFRVALTLIRRGEVTLISCTELHHIITAFQKIAKEQYTWYSHNFMQMIYEESGELTSLHLEKLSKTAEESVLKELGLDKSLANNK